MKLRRYVHKLFDLIKCNKWQSIFDPHKKKKRLAQPTDMSRDEQRKESEQTYLDMLQPNSNQEGEQADEHKQIEEQVWKTIHDTDNLHEYKNLVLRECYLTFYQLSNLDLLELKLNQMKSMLIYHLENDDCRNCDYIGEKCQVCTYPEYSKQVIWVYKLNNYSMCHKCLKKGHPECLE